MIDQLKAVQEARIQRRMQLNKERETRTGRFAPKKATRFEDLPVQEQRLRMQLQRDFERIEKISGLKTGINICR